MFLFYKHFAFDWSQRHYGIRECSFLLNNCLLSNYYLITQKLDSQFLLYKFYMKTAPLIEILSSLKVEKKYIDVYCFRGKHFTCWDLRGMFETDNFG